MPQRTPRGGTKRPVQPGDKPSSRTTTPRTRAQRQAGQAKKSSGGASPAQKRRQRLASVLPPKLRAALMPSVIKKPKAKGEKKAIRGPRRTGQYLDE
jgi:hypothetical protein